MQKRLDPSQRELGRRLKLMKQQFDGRLGSAGEVETAKEEGIATGK